MCAVSANSSHLLHTQKNYEYPKKSKAGDETFLSKDSFVKMRINDRDTEKACDLVRRKEKWMEIKD